MPLTARAGDGSATDGNKIIGVFDVMTGADDWLVRASQWHGSRLGARSRHAGRSHVAIVTAEPPDDDGKDDRQIALWSNTQTAPS